RRRKPRADFHRGLGNPRARLDIGRGSPETEKRKWPEFRSEAVLELGRMRIKVRNLAAVRRIDRPRRGRPLRRAVHVEPPEHLRAGRAWIAASRSVPHLLPTDERVRLPPEHHLSDVAEVPAVADDAVL